MQPLCGLCPTAHAAVSLLGLLSNHRASHAQLLAHSAQEPCVFYRMDALVRLLAAHTLAAALADAAGQATAAEWTGLLMTAYHTLGNLLLTSVASPIEYFSSSLLLATMNVCCHTDSAVLRRHAILTLYCFSSYSEFAEVLLVSGLHARLLEVALSSLVQHTDMQLVEAHPFNPCPYLAASILSHAVVRSMPGALGVLSETMLLSGRDWDTPALFSKVKKNITRKYI